MGNDALRTPAADIAALRGVVAAIAASDADHADAMVRLAVLFPVVQEIAARLDDYLDRRDLACPSVGCADHVAHLAGLGETALRDLDLVGCALAGATNTPAYPHPFNLVAALDAPLAHAQAACEALDAHPGRN
jgi:hypothetical protein